MNLEGIIEFLEEAWAPDTYQSIMKVLQNLRCYAMFEKVLESTLF